MNVTHPPPSESRTRRIVKARAAHSCEITGAYGPTDMSHRLARSGGGQWQPSNLINASHDVHMWLEANPRLADAGGWHVPSWADPLEVPVWLTVPWVGWFLLADDGFLTSVDPEVYGLPVTPVLPGRRAA